MRPGRFFFSTVELVFKYSTGIVEFSVTIFYSGKSNQINTYAQGKYYGTYKHRILIPGSDLNLQKREWWQKNCALRKQTM